MPTSDDDELFRLELQAAALSASVGRLNEDLGDQVVVLAHEAKRNRRLVKALAVSIALDIALSIGLAVGFAKIDNNSDAIAESQRVSQEEALCPVWQAFLDSKSQEAKDRYPKGPEAYEKVFDDIRHGYDVLGCAQLKP
jgi:hypothetical protein